MLPERVSRGRGNSHIVKERTGKGIPYWQYLPLKFEKSKSDFQCSSEALLSKYIIVLSI